MEKLRQNRCSFHIVDMLGQPSGMGSHLTARLPGSETFLFHVHNFGFGEVTPDLIHEADFELNVLSGTNVDINPTLHIHTRIYAARPDVTCILHTHAKHVTALSATGQNITVLTQAARALRRMRSFRRGGRCRTGQRTRLCHGKGSGRPFLHGSETTGF